MRVIIFVSILVSCLFSCGRKTHSESRPANVFGDDDRIPVSSEDYPFSAIGRLSIGCTATLISKRHILTAAHCVYTASGERSASNLTFTPNQINGRGRVVARTRLIGAGTTVPYSDVSTYDKDWAVLEVDQDLGSQFGYIHLVNHRPSAGERIAIAGYSGDYQSGRTATVHENCLVHGRNNQSFLHDCDVTPGASGAAVLMVLPGETGYSVVGVESGERHGTSAPTEYYDQYDDLNANVAVSSSVFFAPVRELIRGN